MKVLSHRFRPVKHKQEDWKRACMKFKDELNYEKTYKELLAGDALRSFLLNKSKQQKVIFKEHVSTQILCQITSNMKNLCCY